MISFSRRAISRVMVVIYIAMRSSKETKLLNLSVISGKNCTIPGTLRKELQDDVIKVTIYVHSKYHKCGLYCGTIFSLLMKSRWCYYYVNSVLDKKNWRWRESLHGNRYHKMLVTKFHAFRVPPDTSMMTTLLNLLHVEWIQLWS